MKGNRNPLPESHQSGSAAHERPSFSATPQSLCASIIKLPHQLGANHLPILQIVHLWPLARRFSVLFLFRLGTARKRPDRLIPGQLLSHPDGEGTMKPLASLSLIVMCIATPLLADQVVRATWYGNEHRGHRTASGETFNPGGRSVAHMSLPFGTCLVVGNPKTGRKVAVRVNDRGPFTPGVTLDLSSGAAQAIGMRSTQSVTMSRCKFSPSIFTRN
jgi:rare lipoprotein A